jgi:hypothetical protein
MKRLLVRALAIVPVVLLFMPLQVTPGERMASKPFELHITDAAGHPIPGLRVVSDNGIVCRTRSDGSTRWTEATVMDRDVQFQIAAPNGNQRVTMHVSPGSRADIQVAR